VRLSQSIVVKDVGVWVDLSPPQEEYCVLIIRGVSLGIIKPGSIKACIKTIKYLYKTRLNY
jgi:hypothetical protein